MYKTSSCQKLTGTNCHWPTMHSFSKITQNEFDPLKNMAAIDPEFPNNLWFNDNSIEGLHPFNFLNITIVFKLYNVKSYRN